MTGSISGSTVAKCKECKCIFTWHCKNFPFIDAEFVGTCSDCISGQKHYCKDETYEPFKVEKELYVPNSLYPRKKS